MPVSLIWFRNDLRVDENDALSHATQSGHPVVGIYIYCPKQWDIHHEGNVKKDFLINNLFALEKRLRQLNIPLIIIKAELYSQCAEEISRFINENNVKRLFFNKEFGVNEEKRDKEVVDLLALNGIETQTFSDQVLFEPGTLKTQQDKPFSVFTPFKRRWIEHFDPDLLDIHPPIKNKDSMNISSNLKSFNLKIKSSK